MTNLPYTSTPGDPPLSFANAKMDALHISSHGETVLVLTKEGVVKACGKEFNDWDEFFTWLIDKLTEINSFEGDK